MTMMYAGYADMWQRVLDMARRMPEVDAIAGVPMSGLAPAGMLSAATGIKCVPLESIPDGIKRLLVLEDASGFAKFRQQRAGAVPGREVLYGTVYACNAAMDLDLIGCVADKPRIFTWNLTKSDKARNIAFDMDGVLCRNPLVEEIDYGQRYSEFVRTAAPLRCAPAMLGWIVTGRMERYRAATEKWLADHGVRYRELVMACDDQKHTAEAHAQHKATWYSAHPECMLFVESHHRQAARIAEITGLPVVCSETEQAWNTRQPEPIKIEPVARNTRIIYTISTGTYSEFAPRDVCVPAGWDYKLITSADCPAYLSPKQQAAWAKVNGPRIFADYESSLCIDDDMTVTQDPTSLFAGSEMTTLHRDVVSTWHQDLLVVSTVRQATDTISANAERERLTSAGFVDSTNYMTGVVWRQHSESVRALCDEWWYWYGQSETQRDQPSLAVACQRMKFAPLTVTEKEIAETIVHDIRKADRDGVRKRVVQLDQTVGAFKKKTHRKGDRI